MSTVYKRDTLSVVSRVYEDFSHLFSIFRGTNESLRNFELRFAAQLSKFHSNGKLISPHESLTAFMLLNNSCVDDAHSVSILSAATSHDVQASKNMDNDEYIKNIQYSSVASVLRQCDRSRHSTHDRNSGTNRTIGSISASFRPRGRNKPRMTPA